jgi:RimJ/RimL family protein N-acetyltransferase
MAPSRVRLRDVTLDDADLLDGWSADPEVLSEYNDFGGPSHTLSRDALREGPLRDDRKGMLVVVLADGTPIGTVSWHRVNYGPPPLSDAWNVGIELIPSARGHGYGTEAQRLLADYLFDTTDLHRVEASTDVENVAEQRSLERAGFVREGIQRGAQFRRGAYHDLVTYARLREDPQDPG